MATDQSERFDQVDWDEISGSTGLSLSINTKLLLLTGIPVLLLGLYDWRIVGPRETTFERLGEDTGLAGVFETIGLDHNPEGLDFLFVFTLLLFLFYIVLPLYQHPRMTKYYWKEFKQNRPAVVSLGWLLVVFVGGLLGPFFISPPEQDILLSHQPPVFTTADMVHVSQCAGEVANGQCHGTWEHPLGTTQAGKDVFASIVHGMTISMQIGFIATVLAVTIATTVGTASAYLGGWTDEILMRYVDIQQSLPTLIVYLLIIYSFGGGLALFILLFGIFSWEGMARYVRSKALGIAEEEYIKAVKVSGASSYRVVRRHVVPNTASSIVTDITLLIPGFLLAEAQLAFLGLGDSTVPSWGQLIASGRSDLAFAPWVVLAPGFVLFLTILAFNFLGDALLDALNPEAEAEADR